MNLFENLQALNEVESLMEMSNIRGKDVKRDYIELSYFFSRKDNNPHGIRVKILFNRDRMTRNPDGYLKLSDDWEYVPTPGSKHIDSKIINDVKSYFKKYKVLFAAVWEDYLDAPDLEDYIKGRIDWSDLITAMTSNNEMANKELEDIKVEDNLIELERIVRTHKFFNMND